MISTISSRHPTEGKPFANVASIAEGTRRRSTGVPFMYVTDMDLSMQDIQVSLSAW
jgi:hypothetical protein